jgi:hypothetical protein
LENVLLARLLEVGADDGLRILLGALWREAHLFCGPQPEQAVAAGDGLELLVLIEGVLGFEALFPIVEGGHRRRKLLQGSQWDQCASIAGAGMNAT